ncbi:MAG TPA: hypothetical protein PKE58_16285 [Acidobacteriota bacterium]|nr:hypothetical protein [Acidobacteriota bacterium]
MSKRVSLNERRTADLKGVDAIITATESKESSQQDQSQPLAKVTLYIRSDQVTAIEEIQLAERKRSGKKPDKSDLIQEAIDMLVAKYSKLHAG